MTSERPTSGAEEPTEAPALPRPERAAITAQLLERMAAAGQRGDVAERARLGRRVVAANLPVAYAVAGRYRGRGVPFDELRQAAGRGLAAAVDHAGRDGRPDLLSLAVPAVRGEVLRCFRDRHPSPPGP